MKYKKHTLVVIMVGFFILYTNGCRMINTMETSVNNASQAIFSVAYQQAAFFGLMMEIKDYVKQEHNTEDFHVLYIQSDFENKNQSYTQFVDSFKIHCENDTVIEFHTFFIQEGEVLYTPLAFSATLTLFAFDSSLVHVRCSFYLNGNTFQKEKTELHCVESQYLFKDLKFQKVTSFRNCEDKNQKY